MAEVLRIQRDTADMQVFEDARGVRVGDPVEMRGNLLSVLLDPGLPVQVFDGLQNPLAALANDHGFFLPRGGKDQGSMLVKQGRVLEVSKSSQGSGPELQGN